MSDLRLRETRISGSANVTGCRIWKTLVSVHHSVEDLKARTRDTAPLIPHAAVNLSQVAFTEHDVWPSGCQEATGHEARYDCCGDPAIQQRTLHCASHGFGPGSDQTR